MYEWLIIFIVLLIVELCTVNLVTIWFAIGSLAAMITSIFTDSMLIMIIVFLVVSCVSLYFTRPLVKKYVNKNVEKTNLDSVVGKKGIVTEEISKNIIGEVKVMGKKWSAVANKKIAVSKSVIVKKIEGVKLVVEEVKDGEEKEK